jgi:arylsulfatase A-like enzyme
MVDSLRRDSLGVYGNGENISPNIDRWANSAIVFERTFAQAPWVKPSATSVFLSQYPMVHTILQFPDKILPRYSTITEWLAKNGYLTAYFSENPLVGTGSGIDQGFDRGFLHAEPSGIRSFISQQDISPFFLFIHPKEPGRPYDLSEDDRKKTLTPEKIKLLNGFLSQLQKLARQNYDRRGADTSFDNSEEQTEILDKIRSYIEDYKKLYKIEVARMDRRFGQLLEILEQSGQQENTLLVFLSSNGEEFFEHDTVMNGDSLYQELIHVPFILSWPKRWGSKKSISQSVELIDLFPTLLELIGENKPMVAQGTSLVPLLDGLTLDKDAWSARINLGNFYKPLDDKQGSYNVALIRWPHKIIYSQSPDTVEIFDLSQDPGEKDDLAEKNNELKEKLKGDLLEWIQIQNSLRITLNVKKDRMVLNKSLREKLKSLGYMD